MWNFRHACISDTRVCVSNLCINQDIFGMPKDLEKQGKANSHDAKVEHHAQDHLHKEADKNCEKQERRR